MTIPTEIDVYQYRKPENDIDELFVRRWSPRAMSGQSIPDKDLMRLFEVARWAPSASNEQPWRFIYAKKGTKYWDVFFDLVAEGNKRWCKNAAVLMVIISKIRFTKYDAENRTHSFSAGSAFENLQLQATNLGLVVHPFAGFDENKAAKVLGIPIEYYVDVMVAIGMPRKIEDLEEKDRIREFPSDRMKLNELIFEGEFNEK
ncbi:nitroreductase family protein [uncultured Methanomethylovorans sp.]|uniref:nitroreductase family protein n=1 Tax=uncultured Methanomethylovorans sp. TaxID=183759 RepID=UPI002AA6C9A5|nr:nitroreductase family protein [uncultured Methanomethylovorans sp.]